MSCLEIHGIDVYDGGVVEVGREGVNERAGAVNPKAYRIEVLVESDVERKNLAADSKSANVSNLKDIVLRSGDVVAALRIHGEAVAALVARGACSESSDKAGLRIDRKALKFRAFLDCGILRLRIGAHEDQKFLVVGRLGDPDWSGIEFGGGALNRNKSRTDVRVRTRYGCRRRDQKRFHRGVAGVFADAVDDRNVLASGFYCDEHRLVGGGRRKRRIADFLEGARGGIGDLKHADAVGADSEEKAALDVDGETGSGGLARSKKGRVANGRERAGLVVTHGDGASGGENEGLLELGAGGGDVYTRGNKCEED